MARGFKPTSVPTRSARPDLYILFVAVDADDGTFPLAWFIPSEEFRTHFVKPNSQGRFHFVASMKPDSADKWSDYRVSRPTLAARVLAALDTLV